MKAGQYTAPTHPRASVNGGLGQDSRDQRTALPSPHHEEGVSPWQAGEGGVGAPDSLTAAPRQERGADDALPSKFLASLDNVLSTRQEAANAGVSYVDASNVILAHSFVDSLT